MPPEAGQTLAHYRLEEPLGRGGMGEVWKATDTRLDRPVAIKLLSPSTSADVEMRQRFVLEARAVAALNHPNICVIHDVGREQDVDFIVMELVEGESLANRLRAGPLPLADTIQSGIEIAQALDEAHAAGIVHRDLKPANIMLTRRGTKLLDFGLAKRVPRAAASGEVATEPATVPGRVLGTLPYMAPEQLRGDPAEPRTDVFALGAVLFEMVTGRRPFEARTDADLIASILSSPAPSILTDRPEAPPFLDRLIARCLAKSPDDRWPSAASVSDELQWLGATPEEPSPRGRRRQGDEATFAIEYLRSHDGAVIAAARGGAGPPLLVVPTMADTIETSWSAYASAFPGRELITYDRRGFGLSERDAPADDPEVYLGDAQAVVEGLHLSSFDLLGTLLGTVEAAVLAARHPTQVGRVVLRSPVIGLADWAQIPVVRAALAALEHDWEFFTEAFSQLVVGWGDPRGHDLAERFRQVTSRDELRSVLYAYSRFDLAPSFGAIRAPTLVEHHPTYFFPPAYSRSIASMIPGCRMAIYDGRDGEFMTDLSLAQAFLR